MLVDDSGRIEGSVTGGCVEGALVEEAQGVLAGAPPRVATYGISDQQAADVGLMCGGTVRVFVHELGEPQRAALTATREAIEADRPVALATLLEGPGAGAKMVVTEEGTAGSLGVAELLDQSVEREARGFLDEGRSALRRYSSKGEVMGVGDRRGDPGVLPAAQHGDLRRHRLQRGAGEDRRRRRLPGDDRGRARGLPSEPALQ